MKINAKVMADDGSPLGEAALDLEPGFVNRVRVRVPLKVTPSFGSGEVVVNVALEFDPPIEAQAQGVPLDLSTRTVVRDEGGRIIGGQG